MITKKLIPFKASHRSKLALFLLAGTLTVGPFLHSPMAHAKPIKDKDLFVVVGTVTRDTPGNDFYIRADDGTRYLVVTGSQPDDVVEGARVKVTGVYDGNQISASYVGVLTNDDKGNNGGGTDNSGNSGQRRMTITGVVTRDPGGDDFYVRADDGTVYLVSTHLQPERVKKGVRVKIKGWFDGDELRANDIAVLGNADDSDYGNNDTRDLTVTGVVTNDTPGHDFYIRGDDGVKYLVVMLSQPKNITEGVRVTVNGLYDGNQITASSVRVIGDSPWNNSTKEGTMTVTGVVTRDPAGNDFYMKTDSGDIYLVITKSQPRGVDKGTRVKVKGWFDGDHLNANDVDVLGDNDNGSKWNNGRQLVVAGMVTKRNDGNDFYMQSDDGKEYHVYQNNLPENVKRNKRVKVTGRMDGNRLKAEYVGILKN